MIEQYISILALCLLLPMNYEADNSLIYTRLISIQHLNIRRGIYPIKVVVRGLMLVFMRFKCVGSFN